PFGDTFTILTVTKHKIDLSYFIIQLNTNSKDKEGELSNKNLTTILKLGLNRFSITLFPSYTRTRFCIGATVNLSHLEKIKDFLQTALTQAKNIFKLKH